MPVNDRVNVVLPYARQLLDDEDVQDAARRAIDATRDSYRRIRGRSPKDAIADEKLRRRSRQAAVAVWEVWSGLSAPPSRRRSRRRALTLVVISGAGVFLAVNADARAAVLGLFENATNH